MERKSAKDEDEGEKGHEAQMWGGDQENKGR